MVLMFIVEHNSISWDVILFLFIANFEQINPPNVNWIENSTCWKFSP